MKNAAEGLLDNIGKYITEYKTADSTGRLLGRGHFSHKILEADSRKYTYVRYVQTHTGKTGKKHTTVYCWKCNTGLCF
jgi:hypothetical protein